MRAIDADKLKPDCITKDGRFAISQNQIANAKPIQTSTDAVSRQAILDCKYSISDDEIGERKSVVDVADIYELPPVTPKPNLEKIYSDLLRVKHNTMSIDELIDKAYADMRGEE